MEILIQPANSTIATQQNFSVLGNPLNEVQEFTYLGSALSYNADLTSEVHKCVKLASAAFGRLSHHNSNLTKGGSLSSLCVFILLYGRVAWTPYRHHRLNLYALPEKYPWCWLHRITHTQKFLTELTSTLLNTLCCSDNYDGLGCNSHVSKSSASAITIWRTVTLWPSSLGRPRLRFSNHIGFSMAFLH